MLGKWTEPREQQRVRCWIPQQRKQKKPLLFPPWVWPPIALSLPALLVQESEFLKKDSGWPSPSHVLTQLWEESHAFSFQLSWRDHWCSTVKKWQNPTGMTGTSFWAMFFPRAKTFPMGSPPRDLEELKCKNRSAAISLNLKQQLEHESAVTFLHPFPISSQFLDSNNYWN